MSTESHKTFFLKYAETQKTVVLQINDIPLQVVLSLFSS